MMLTDVTRFRPKLVLIFVLITAMLTMQSASAHIHVAAHHAHDGRHHQHNIEAHAHQLASHNNHHSDTIDSSHQADYIRVVELDHKYNTPKGEKQKTPSKLVAIKSDLQQVRLDPYSQGKLPLVINTKHNCLRYSTVNPRAPPCFS